MRGAVEQVGARHVRRAGGLALAAAQAVLDRGRDLADVALLHDQRLVAHQAEARRVGVGEVGARRARVAHRPAQQLSLVEPPFGIDALLVAGKGRQLRVGQVFELGDADAVLARDHAVEAPRELHDPRDRRMRGLQHLVVVAVDGDVGVHVAVAGMHVQGDPDAALQHLAVDLLARVDDGLQRRAGEDRFERRADSGSSTRRAACGPGAGRRRCGPSRRRPAGPGPRASRATARRPRAAAPARAARGPRAARPTRCRRRRRSCRAAGCRSRETPRAGRRARACSPGSARC